MSQQGERPAAHEDDWWRRLYDENARDTGTSNAADSLDDRFDSASDAVSPGGRGGSDGEAGATPEVGAVPVEVSRPVRERAPWEPPVTTVRASGKSPASPAGPSQPRTFAAPPVPVDPAPVPDQPSAPGERSAPELPAEASSRDAVSTPPVPTVPPLPRRPVSERPVAPQAPLTTVTAPTAPAPEAERETVLVPRPVIGHVGDRPPTYDAEPTALPATVPSELDGLVSDTVLDGARYGTYTLRAASVRGDSARFRGEPRRDALLTARFGTDERALVLVAVATGARATESAHLAAADACRWIGAAVGRSHVRLSEDIRAGRRGDLKSGLNRLTDRTYGKLRARAAELGLEPQQYTAGLRCLLLSADPDCRTRVFFGIGAGGLFRLRDGIWQDLEPEAPAAGDIGTDPMAGSGSGSGSGAVSPESGPGGDRLTMDLDIATPVAPYVEALLVPPAEPFRFRGSVARPGDTLLLCSPGLAEPLRGEPDLARELAGRWAPDEAPGLVAFLADTQLRVKGYADDRTGVGVWEA
ncbi:protein phosphatase 2C domain-containing protein [Streptomyces sp. NBC_01591]|uniref:protein phosphatase 2C domain-containing protein n=1 Tax=Streptomyces sp. NBC_01591 TaxID=2975888 RepID=UPI002DD8175D|nr:protein phosphatase 2C domain-containing protein [Streptomyces sp. NBC_01591]WSD71601.1 protein phosphatase 2C domain-containing protein [Streptomyces sp. NBC_01591]